MNPTRLDPFELPSVAMQLQIMLPVMMPCTDTGLKLGIKMRQCLNNTGTRAIVTWVL